MSIWPSWGTCGNMWETGEASVIVTWKGGVQVLPLLREDVDQSHVIVEIKATMNCTVGDQLAGHQLTCHFMETGGTETGGHNKLKVVRL